MVDLLSFFIYISGVDISDSDSVSISVSLLSDFYGIRNPSCASSPMSYSSEISSATYSTSSSSGFSSSDPSYSFPVMSSKMGIPGAHSNIGYWSNVGCFSIFFYFLYPLDKFIVYR